jgi:hypothetical protein
MELTEEEAKERLEREDNLVNTLIAHRTMHDGQGKKPGDVAIPKEIKALIALTSDGQSQAEVGEAFNVSGREVGLIKSGRVSPRKSDPELVDIREKKKETASEQALANLLELLTAVPAHVKTATKLRDVASAAKDMATVHEKLTGSKQNGQGVNVLIYAPRVSQESRYATVEVEATIID